MCVWKCMRATYHVFVCGLLSLACTALKQPFLEASRKRGTKRGEEMMEEAH